MTSGIVEEDRSFPGNTFTGICMIAAPVLGIVGSLLGIGIYQPDSTDFAHDLGTHHVRGEWAINLSMVAVVLLVFAVAGIARRITVRRPSLGRAGGILTILGLFGPAFFLGIFFGASQVVDPATRTTAAALMARAQTVPGTVVNLAGPALVVGFLLLGIGAIKAGVLARPRGWALALGVLLPVGFMSDIVVISAVGALGIAVALVPLGVELLPSSRRLTPAVEHQRG